MRYSGILNRQDRTQHKTAIDVGGCFNKENFHAENQGSSVVFSLFVSDC